MKQCFKRNNVSKTDAEAVAKVMVKNAGISWKGMMKFAGSLMNHCNTNGDRLLDYNEAKKCLEDFGLTDEQMKQARNELMKYSVITFGRFRKSVK